MFSSLPYCPCHAAPQIERLLNDSRNIGSINLSNNQLGNDGALAIARSLPYTHWLVMLDLRSNNIGEQVRPVTWSCLVRCIDVCGFTPLCIHMLICLTLQGEGTVNSLS